MAAPPGGVFKAIAYGNTAQPLAAPRGNSTHTWTVYVKSPCSEVGPLGLDLASLPLKGLGPGGGGCWICRT
jgi:hypothetical protein